MQTTSPVQMPCCSRTLAARRAAASNSCGAISRAPKRSAAVMRRRSGAWQHGPVAVEAALLPDQHLGELLQHRFRELVGGDGEVVGAQAQRVLAEEEEPPP